MYSGPRVLANHIIGGDMFYECLGFLNDDPRTNTMVFRITMDLYRDCQARNAAFFDNPAGLTVYRGNSAPYEQIDDIRVRYMGFPEDIDPPNFPCLNIPPNVCVHKARYVFEVELELSAESYHVIWQRCCRNESITNIFFPGDVGATFTVEITPVAQQRCNNSPQFTNFPPTVICAGEPLRFDHSATDAEGDDLVYEFCAPLTGGGLNFGGGGCDTPNPNPDCPPPFGTVQFRAPQFTSSNPIAGNPRVSMDRVTGEIRGTPNLLGQFVVGVCVREFRNGELLSIIRRDFQFNVSTCTSNFTTDLDANGRGSGDEYIVSVCNGLTTDIVNRSTGIIDSVRWEVDLPDSTMIRTDVFSPTLTFPYGGNFPGRLIINPDTPCSDTADIEFQVVESLNADFAATYDTCVSGPVSYEELGTVVGGEIIGYQWELGERKTDTTANPTVFYDDPGTFDVQLIVIDESGCEDTVRKQVVWQPAPEVIVVEPNIEEGCDPLDVSFRNLSYPVDSSYDIKWYFSDGQEASGLSPKVQFSDTGAYNIRVEITSPIGCYTEEDFTDVVRVFPKPQARLLIDSVIRDEFNNEVNLSDISLYNLGREWWIEGGGVRFDSTLSYAFTDTGIFEVRLIAVDRFGCADTTVGFVDVAPVSTFYLPNAFTPNADSRNDDYKGVGLTEGIKNFELVIFDRWGQRIFETQNPSKGWDGNIQSSGRQCPEGIYIARAKYVEPRGQWVEKTVQISLIR
jgi:gliding motility-associated-like protein